MEKIAVFFDQLLENSSPRSPIWNQEALMEDKPLSWSYIDGCMILAVQKMYHVTKDEKYLNFMENFIDFYIDESGNPLGFEESAYNSDAINEGKVLFQLYEITKKEKYRKAIEKLYRQVLLQPRTSKGSLWHKLIYPQQVWLDGLYMVQPFSVMYELLYQEQPAIKEIMLQFELVATKMIDPATGLYYHGYDCSKLAFWADDQTGCSKHFWTRSLGWFAMALVDTAVILKESGRFKEEQAQLQEYLQALLAALLPFQDKKSQLFFQVTNESERPGNYLETSGSAALAYVMLKGYRTGLLTKEYALQGEQILNSLNEMKLIENQEGYSLKDICLVAGLGGMPGKGAYKERDGSFDYYVSEPVVENDAKGIGPLVFAYTEWLLLNKQ
ncbi:glycoside hydrolase family 88/105 protein [Enterococcus sp. DIV0876]|uniref:glycoside hydrolase family 88/105 protein n=1 Tax=Enterococcus sp. DIV0876 TaxID=2774633 RepID=UPI003D2FBA5F